jgi:hypothetical protein
MKLTEKLLKEQIEKVLSEGEVHGINRHRGGGKANRPSLGQGVTVGDPNSPIPAGMKGLGSGTSPTKASHQAHKAAAREAEKAGRKAEQERQDRIERARRSQNEKLLRNTEFEIDLIKATAYFREMFEFQKLNHLLAIFNEDRERWVADPLRAELMRRKKEYAPINRNDKYRYTGAEIIEWLKNHWNRVLPVMQEIYLEREGMRNWQAMQENKFKLSSRDIRRMIQEELENVLEARTFGGRPDGYMYPGEEEERMRQLGMMKNAQVSPEDKPPSPSMSAGGKSPSSYLMELEAECEKDGPGSEACMQVSKMEQFMYGQGDRMHEGKKKRKKNG